MYCRCEGNVLEALQPDREDTMLPSTTDSADDFNSFRFWRIEPDVIDDRSVMSACGDSLASVVISSTTDNWSQLHTIGDSAQYQHSHVLPDSNHNLKESTYF